MFEGVPARKEVGGEEKGVGAAHQDLQGGLIFRLIEQRGRVRSQWLERSEGRMDILIMFLLAERIESCDASSHEEGGMGCTCQRSTPKPRKLSVESHAGEICIAV